jgi:cell division protein FtsI (penicillin-binding protein 3)
MAIGYELLQTPLQVLSFYNAIANDGKMMRPQFVQEVRKNGSVVQRFDPIVIHENFCSDKTIEKARKMMEGVMEEGGTADWVYKNSSYKVAGKTGTAWLNEGDGYVHRRYRASFVGYFPANDPKYSCIVVINNPQGAYYGSAVAAPVFKELSDRICSTQLEFHSPVEERPVVVDQKGTIPVSKNGSSAQLATVFKGLNIPVAGNQSGEWVNTSSGDKEVNVQALQIQPGLVPNVKGMGLRDALHLLENMGLKVTAHGSGKVDHQSVAPGTPVKNAKYITITLS